MDDQTRGETPGTGPGFDAPLKRDRKRLRSSEPLPTGTSSVPPPARMPDEPEELLEPELTPVEQLFGGGQFTAPTVSLPELPAEYDVDLAGEGTVPAPDEGAAKRRLGLNFRRKPADEAPAETAGVESITHEPVSARRAEPETPVYRRFEHDQAVTDYEPAAPALPTRTPSTPAAPPRVPTEPYVPPGGFSGPGHPRLGPLAPMPAERHPGLARLDIAAIIAAVVLPPLGLITAIIALIRGKQVRGWASDLARAAVSVSVVMTIVFAGVGGYVWLTETEKAEQLAVVKAEQRAHDRVAAASAPFCEVLAAHPTIYSTADPDYGWPAVDAPAGYNAAIAEYAGVWAQLAAVAPEGIAVETAAISERVAGIVNIANALGSSNRAGDLLGLHASDDLATVESWYVEYCSPAEIPAE